MNGPQHDPQPQQTNGNWKIPANEKSSRIHRSTECPVCQAIEVADAEMHRNYGPHHSIEEEEEDEEEEDEEVWNCFYFPTSPPKRGFKKNPHQFSEIF